MDPAASSSASSKPKKKFATLGDLQSSGSGHGDHGHPHDDDDEPEDDPNLFAGGEKSGLAVQNPDTLKRQILERAKRAAGRPGGDDPTSQRSNFTGTARTLGGDDAPSQTIPDPTAQRPQRAQRVTRTLYFWQDGFSVDDGPLFRFDDPENAEILAQIKKGRAPMRILNVEVDQEVDVSVVQNHEQKYQQPKKKYKPFEGSGQRLGSPAPDVAISAPPATSVQSTPAASAAGGGNQQPGVDVDESQPTVSLQIRLGDGTRLSSRFNTTHTIGDVYGFVNAASESSQARNWVLMTTFPSKELNDKNQVLGDMADFKRGGVVVQKWT